MFLPMVKFSRRVGIRIVPPAPRILKGSKMFEFYERRKNSRSLVDPAKARKDFWAMKLAEHEREIKLFGCEKTA
jgi:hypothetical protein